jgi:hypothetical protein
MLASGYYFVAVVFVPRQLAADSSLVTIEFHPADLMASHWFHW